MDLWLIRTERAPDEADLLQMVAAVVRSGLPGLEHRTVPATHPYTTAGRQIDVRTGDQWIEVGECGLALPGLLSDSGLPAPQAGGLAMGLGVSGSIASSC